MLYGQFLLFEGLKNFNNIKFFKLIKTLNKLLSHKFLINFFKFIYLF